jgi:hypothetical protein
LHVHDDAKADLDALWGEDEAAAARIEATLQEIEGDQDLLDRLTQNNFGRERRDTFNVRLVENQARIDNNIWRLKVWCLERRDRKYRVIYAYFPTTPTTGTYYVLGIMPREIDYDRDHEFIRRIESAYQELQENLG